MLPSDIDNQIDPLYHHDQESHLQNPAIEQWIYWAQQCGEVNNSYSVHRVTNLLNLQTAYPLGISGIQ